MTMRWCLVALLVLCTVGRASARPLRKVRLSQGKRVVVKYQGRLADLKAKNVSGIFQFRFSLYGDDDSGTPLWSAEHYVSVVVGRYVIELGRDKAIPSSVFKRKKLFLGVRVDGGTEFREQLSWVASDPTFESPFPKKNAPSEPGPKLVEKSKYALEAKIAMLAQDAKRFNGLTLEQLIARIKSELTKKRVVLSFQDTHYSKRAGGSGGTDHFLTCRKNYVMTGIHVRSGLMVDSIEAICTRVK
ncbi:MAG: hypothetical protein KC609_14660 [Myxococcales bacterium]|nr:hypothetical protein [Myxococcales bacterium]